jgi:hypothetical protein
MKSLAFAVACKANRLLWKMGMIHQGRFTSPHLVCTAVLPDSASQSEAPSIATRISPLEGSR